MARGPFPTGAFGRTLSDNVYQPNHTADASTIGADALASGARAFSRQLRGLADKAYEREGLRDAAEAIQAGDMIDVEPSLRTGTGVDDIAYNTAIREQLVARRSTAFGEELDKAETANATSVTGFTDSLAAVRAAFEPTGDAELDLALSKSIELQTGAAMRRVRAGEEQRRVQIARGAFVETASAGQTILGQAVSSAGFDEPGAVAVGQALGDFYQRLSRFGPREAFTVGGIEFAADPTRADAMTAAELVTLANTATVNARTSWIENAAERVTDPAAKRAFIGQVRERWEAGDAMFAGLDATDMGRLSARLEQGADRADADRAATMRAAGERARNLLSAGEYGDDVDMEELRGLGAASGDPGLIAQIEFAAVNGFEATPASLRSAAAANGGGAAGFEFSVNVLLDQLEGSGFVANDGGRGRSQWGVTEASHPEAWRDGRVDRAEAVRVAREYWDGIGGDGLDPDLAVAALAAAYVGGIGTAQDLLARSNGDLDTFLSLEEARFRSLAGNDRAKLNGWLARQGKVRGAIGQQRAQRRAADGYATDPIGYARGTRRRSPLASVEEMSPQMLFDGDGAAVERFLSARRATGQTLAERDGVPQRMFASEEVAVIRDRIAANPGDLITLARRAGRALGGEGARDMLRELNRGGVSGADLQLAQLALEPTNNNIVALAVQGRAYRLENGVPPKFESGEAIDDVLRAAGGAFQSQPELASAVRGLATDMAYGDVASGNQKGATAYVNSALGATTRDGRRFGGLAEINGAQTILPQWLRADRLDETLDLAARMFEQHRVGPVYSNGNPIPARVLERYRLRAMPQGGYQMIDPATGRPAAAANGHAFIFDIEQDSFRAYLRRELPDAVLRGR